MKVRRSRKQGPVVYKHVGKLPTVSLEILPKLWVKYDKTVSNVFTKPLVVFSLFGFGWLFFKQYYTFHVSKE